MYINNHSQKPLNKFNIHNKYVFIFSLTSLTVTDYNSIFFDLFRYII